MSKVTFNFAVHLNVETTLLNDCCMLLFVIIVTVMWLKVYIIAGLVFCKIRFNLKYLKTEWNTFF